MEVESNDIIDSPDEIEFPDLDNALENMINTMYEEGIDLSPTSITHNFNKHLSGEFSEEIYEEDQTDLKALQQENNQLMGIDYSQDYLTPDEIRNLEADIESEPEYEGTEIEAEVKVYPQFNENELMDVLDTLLDDEAPNIQYQVTEITEEEEYFVDHFELPPEPETPEDIRKALRSPDKKMGTAKEKIINVVELGKSLIFQDLGEELHVLVRNKLCLFWDCVLDFSGVKNVSEVFFKFSLGDLCRWLTPNEVLERVEIVNLIETDSYASYISILENRFKYWQNEDGQDTNINHSIIQNERGYSKDDDLTITVGDLNLQQEIYDDKYNRPHEVYTFETIPFKRIQAKYLGRKREKKLNYPVYYIENITNEIIEQYALDNKIENFIRENLAIDWEQVAVNNKCHDKLSEKFSWAFDLELFNSVFGFTQGVLIDSCYWYLEELKNEIHSLRKELAIIKESLPDYLVDAYGNGFQGVSIHKEVVNKLPTKIRHQLRRMEDLEFSLMDKEHRYFIKEDICKNIFEVVQLSLYEEGIDKVKLIAYHYLCKVLEEEVMPLWEKLPRKSIRGFRIPLEVFRYELVEILIKDIQLRRFMFTMKALIEKWVIKYGRTSAIARFYYEVLMTSPQALEEMVLRYLILTVIKNKNPMTLRAIFSAYISLVHNSIFHTLNDGVNKKHGFFSHLNKIVTEGIYVPRDSYANNKYFWTESMLKAWIQSHPKLLRDDYCVYKEMDYGQIFEPNNFVVYNTKPKDMALSDWWWVYTKFGRFLKLDERYEKYNRIRINYIKKNKKHSHTNYITMLVYEHLREPIFESVGDYDNTDQILKVFIEDISMRTSNSGFMDVNNNLILNNTSEFLDDIRDIILKIRDNIIDGNRIPEDKNEDII